MFLTCNMLLINHFKSRLPCSLANTTSCTFSMLRYFWSQCRVHPCLSQHLPIADIPACKQIVYKSHAIKGKIFVPQAAHQQNIHTSSGIHYWSQSTPQTGQTREKKEIPNFKTSSETKRTDRESCAIVEQCAQKELYSRIVESFPDVQMAFAYGSGAFQQKNSLDVSKNMLDFIFVVDKPRKWHRLNLEKHPHHYSFLKRFGPQTIARIQERYGAGIYFNTLVPMEGRLIKYGVISTPKLITDLLDWESLYVSGRLHKPVSLIIIPKNEDLLTAMKVNLQSAVHAALLLLPDMFTEEQFYTTVASLSYAGDFRMGIAEDSQKISNIVKPNIEPFRRMYGPILQEEEHVTWWQMEGQLEQALTFHSRHHHLKCLPSRVLHRLSMEEYQVGVFPDLEDIIKRYAYDSECAKHVATSVRHIVKHSSLTQSLKGILTAGFVKSVRYSTSKVLKKIRSR